MYRYSTVDGAAASNSAPKASAVASVQPVVHPEALSRSGTFAKLGSGYDRLISRTSWFSEIVAIFASVLVIATMGIELRKFQGRAVAEWTAPMNLNSLVALLVTLLWAFLMQPVSSCLSQLRWNHFASNKPHSLYDFQLIERASRGIGGSIALIAQRPTIPLAGAAAFLTIAFHAIGPFAQQIISIDIVNTPVAGTANVPVSNAFFRWPADSGTGRVGMDDSSPLRAYDDLGRKLPIDRPYGSYVYTSDMIVAPAGVTSAIWMGLTSPVEDDFGVTAMCAGTNCTWNSYSSLVVDSGCTYLPLQINPAANTTWTTFMASGDNKFKFSLTDNWSNYSSADLPSWTINDTDRKLLATTNVLSLPHTNNFTLWDTLVAHFQVLGIYATYSNGLTHFTTNFSMQPDEAIDPYTHTLMVNSEISKPAFAIDRAGTVLVTQILYVEAILTNQSVTLGNFSVTECSLDFAVKEYSAETTYGQFREGYSSHVFSGEPLGPDEISARVFTLASTSLQIDCSTSNMTSTTIIPQFEVQAQRGLPMLTFREPRIEVGQNVFAVDPWSAIGVAESLYQILQGNDTSEGWVSAATNPNEFDNTPDLHTMTSDMQSFTTEGTLAIWKPQASILFARAIAAQIQAAAKHGDPSITVNGIMENVAKSLTKYLRAGSGSQSAGTVLVARAVFVVDWRWFSIPILLLALSCVLLIATIFNTRHLKIPVWTDSSIAVMFHGESSARYHVGSLAESDVYEMHSMAKKMEVRLVGNRLIADNKVMDYARTHMVG